MLPKNSIFFFCCFLLFFIFFLDFVPKPVDSQATSFTFNGFSKANMAVDGCSSLSPNGYLGITAAMVECTGHAFNSVPLRFRAKPNSTFSFSTTFVFAVRPENGNTGPGSRGMAFVISPTDRLWPEPETGWMLGVFNSTNNGLASNHIVAVAFKLKNNSVNININSHKANVSRTAGYYDKTGNFFNLSLSSGQRMQVCIDYESESTVFNVTMSPIFDDSVASSDGQPMISTKVDLNGVILQDMYVGFSANSGSSPTNHYVLGCSFQVNGRASDLDLRNLPRLPKSDKNRTNVLLPVVISLAALLLIAAIVAVVVKRINKYAEVLEDWEVEYGPHRFPYKDLYRATKGFKDSELLGAGGFGKVYRGVLSKSQIEVAVKKISHDSKQGMKEFVAEIVSIGRLRHRNLVQLLGYCRRKGELLLVYDYMPNGSLDSFLFGKSKETLDWNQRFRIIKGVASALLYLHEGWEQVVIHRDVKASNIMLDADLNGRLGDFGLARLHDHGEQAQTTNLVGTMGYIAPELARTGKASTATDVFAFGAFLLEVACGRRPIEPKATAGEVILMDQVLLNWMKGSLLSSADPTLAGVYVPYEVDLVLKLGLICTHSMENARPSMKVVMQYLDGELPLPGLSPSDYLKDNTVYMSKDQGFGQFDTASYLSSPLTEPGSSLLRGVTSTGR